MRRRVAVRVVPLLPQKMNVPDRVDVTRSMAPSLFSPLRARPSLRRIGCEPFQVPVPRLLELWYWRTVR